MAYRRSDRVSVLLLQEVVEFVRRDLKDPNLGFVTFTGVDLTDDLRHAKVYIVVRGGEEEKKRAFEILAAAAGRMRKRLGRNLKIRYAPTLTFLEDSSFDNAERIQRLLDRIHDEEKGP
ncbi:MAG: 30S ribosome-binding factor RbfA [Candidatus Eisenbacteria bacterium]